MDYFTQIQAYLEKTLEPDAMIAFEKAMAADASLKEAVEIYPLVNEMFAAAENREIKQAIISAKERMAAEEVSETTTLTKAIEAEAPPQSGAKIIQLNRLQRAAKAVGAGALIPILATAAVKKLAVAASVALVAGSITYPNLNYTDYRIVNASYIAPDDPTVEMGDVSSESALKGMYEAWNQGDKLKAIELGKEARIKYPDDTRVTYHLAHFQSQEEQYEAAIEGFEDLYDDLIYGEEAKYYSALAHIALGDTHLATQLLEILSNDPNSRMQDDSEAVLKKLSSGWRKLVF